MPSEKANTLYEEKIEQVLCRLHKCKSQSLHIPYSNVDF